MKRRLSWDETAGILLLALSAGLLCISVFLCGGSDLWYDELFTMGLAKSPLDELISITARDVHPPLYYMIVKLFLTVFGGRMGSEVTVAKLASVLPFFLCLSYALTKVRKYFGMFAAGLFSFLLVTMPQLADYTVEVRMYGWALFFVTAGMLHAYELVSMGGEMGEGICPSSPKAKEKSKDANLAGEEKNYHRKNDVEKNAWKEYMNWGVMTALLLAACYTHYFACAAAGMIYLYLFAGLWREGRLKRNGKPFLASILFCGAGYLPWILAAVTRQVAQVKANYWIPPLSWRSLGGCAKFLFRPSFTGETWNNILAVLLFLCYGGLLIVSVLRGIKRKEERREAFFSVGCGAVLAGLVAFGFLASFLVRPIFVYRYMLPALGVFWLGFALLVSAYRDKRYVAVPILLFLVMIGLRNYRSFYGAEMWKKVQMDETKKAFSQIGDEDIVVCNFDQMQAVAAYYFSQDIYLWYGQPEPLIQEMYPNTRPLVGGEFSDEAGIAALKNQLASGRPVWFMGSGKARDEIIEKWQDAGIEAQERASAMEERYWFNLYRIFLKDE